MNITRSIFMVLVSTIVAAAWGCPSKAPAPAAETREAPRAPEVKPRASSGEATLLLMADIRGILRPCGCTVDLQKGGFDRLIPYLMDERSAHPGSGLWHAGPLLAEAATIAPSNHAQHERQSQVAADLVKQAGFDVVGLTAVDLAASGEAFGALAERTGARLTAANLTTASSGVLPSFLIETVGDLEFGVFALASPAESDALGAMGRVSEPREAARRVIAEMAGRVDVVVLLSALGLRETKRLVRKVPGIHFAVVGGMGEHPMTSDEAELVGATRVMQFHREGRFVGRLQVKLVDGETTFVDASQASAAELRAMDGRIATLEANLKRWAAAQTDADSRQVRSAKHHLASLKDERARLGAMKVDVPTDTSAFSFSVTPLNWDLPQDPDILALMDAFDVELKQINLKNAGTLPQAKPGEAVYVGVQTCLECHDEAQQFWDTARHNHAWETLVELNKTFDASCVSCHVTGYGEAGGSLVGQTKGREDVQCESCHGPGSLHAEDGEPRFIRLSPAEETCTGCHNTHHSPNFNFSRFKKKLYVPGHGEPL